MEFIEEWRPVQSHEGYEVSSRGRVRSSKLGAPRILKGRKHHKDGYLSVILCGPGKTRKTIDIHLLVMAAFVGPRPPGLQVCHFDGNPENNTLTNLRYDTPAANGADKKRHGTHPAGENNPRCKLTDVQVEQVREMRAAGMTLQSIASNFGVTFQLVSLIAKGKTRPPQTTKFQQEQAA